MDDQRKDHINPKEPKQKKRPEQLQTHNLPIDDVENINSTNLQLANKPWDAAKIQKHRRVTLHRSAQPRREPDQRENLAMAWIHYKKLDDKLPQNVQNIRWNHKLYQENLESAIDSRRKKHSCSEDPEEFFKKMHYHPYNS